MKDLDKIEIIMDQESQTYHAFWRPPLAIGAGSTKVEALQDMQEAIRFCIDSMIAEALASIATATPQEGEL